MGYICTLKMSKVAIAQEAKIRRIWSPWLLPKKPQLLNSIMIITGRHTTHLDKKKIDCHKVI
jgi:hypothetical protein